MKCFKHLCTKLFFCLFVGSMGFTFKVNATELTDEITDATEAAVTMDAVEAMESTEIMDVVVPTETVAAAETADAAIVNLLAALNARAQDVDRLGRIIQTEGGTFDDKVCVGLTVLHRVDSPQFPNTVEENINAPSQYAKPAKGTVLPENLLAAEYAMQLWESGMSYSILPNGYLYFAGNGKRNRFRDTHGNHYDAPEIIQIFTPYIIGPDVGLFHGSFFDDFFSDIEFFHVFAYH